jgi:putative acetyltransferase
LAPLCVALDHREKGVGSKLIVKSFELAKDMGFKSIFVVGNPDYYCRFGFKSSVLFGIRHVPPIPDQFVMAYELSAGALSEINGTVSLS